MDLIDQKVLDVNLKTKQKVTITGNLDLDRNATMFFIIQE